ncbi:MAG: mannose-1-phosphate guanylyltransferase/mannose-6-phosphate isomerase [Chlamydiae bacterium]|nr:mannose-1-phosphate guanylyltransferase/mannose-6-phosphate isomerase [Chlamydiota bacterium]
MKIVILAGGSGSRLWPLSRRSLPKQFLHFGDGETLLQKTINRFLKKYKCSDLLIVTNKDYFFHVKHQVNEIDPLLENQILVEPFRKNTGPAIALTVKYMQERLKIPSDECFLVSPSDAVISPEEEFLKHLQSAEKIANKGFHVLFGIHPSKPETGYGYIHYSQDPAHKDSFLVNDFIEKPSHEKALEFLLQGNHLWNSGIFLFQIDQLLKDLKTYAPNISCYLQSNFHEMYEDFEKMPNISIDHALLEKAKRRKVIPINVSWSDLGSWDSIYDSFEKDENQNVIFGNVLSNDTKNCLIFSKKRMVSTLDIEDLLIVDTEDALFIGKKGSSQKVKKIIDQLQLNHASLVNEHPTVHRPWGIYTVLEEGNGYKIKKITVFPQQKLSLQMHKFRNEHWVIVRGMAKVTLNEKIFFLNENENTYIPKESLHRLENPLNEPLELIEVQLGQYVGEDDIIRFEDIYGRPMEKEPALKQT